MTTTLPTQEQVDRIAAELAPDVVRIRMDVTEDWAGEPAIYFRVILSDEAGKLVRTGEITRRVKSAVKDGLGIESLDHHAYFRWRSVSEQATMQGSLWE